MKIYYWLIALLFHVALCLPREFLLQNNNQSRVNNTSPSFMIYIIAHDQQSFATAKHYAANLTWAKPVLIRSTVYFESIAYVDVFPERYSEWADLSYVGMLSYKVAKGSIVPIQGMHSFAKLIRDAASEGFDCVPFIRGGLSLLEQGIRRHRADFLTVWNLLLTRLGYSEQKILDVSKALPFFRNAFVVRPMYMKMLCFAMQKAMLMIALNTDLQIALNKNSFYPGRPNVALRIFNATYYKMHPFVFERMTVFFLYAFNASVCSPTSSQNCLVNI
jgi:hypothetical protein